MLDTLVLVLLGTLSVVFLYLRLRYNYWHRRGVPQPPVVFGFGNILDAFLMKRNPGLIFDEIYREFPDSDAVGVFWFWKPKLLLKSPELIKKVLVSDFSSFHDNEFYVSKRLEPHFSMDPFTLKGDEWKKSRARLIPTTTSARIKEIFPFFKEVVPRLEAYLDEHLGKDIETKTLSTLFTMDNVSNSVFGISSNCFSDPNAVFRKMGNIALEEGLKLSNWVAMVHKLMPTLRDLLGLRFIPLAVTAYLEKIVNDVIEFRRKSNLTRNDMLQFFIKKADGNFEEIMFYAVTFFIEAFETSAMVASVTLYELAKNPDIQEKLFQEIISVLHDKAEVDHDDLNNMPYLNKILQEAQRKYPIIYTITRECTKETSLNINGKPVNIEVGTPVIVPVLSIHRDPQYYPEPEVFDPERFSEESKAARPPQTYMPFGDGPRMCPGVRFGLTQIKLLITSVVLKYRLLPSERTPPALTLSLSSLLVLPKEEQWIRIERR